MKYIYPIDKLFAQECIREAGFIPSPEETLALAKLNAQRFESLTCLQVRQFINGYRSF